MSVLNKRGGPLGRPGPGGKLGGQIWVAEIVDFGLLASQTLYDESPPNPSILVKESGESTMMRISDDARANVKLEYLTRYNYSNSTNSARAETKINGTLAEINRNDTGSVEATSFNICNPGFVPITEISGTHIFPQMTPDGGYQSYGFRTRNIQSLTGGTVRSCATFSAVIFRVTVQIVEGSVLTLGDSTFIGGIKTQFKRIQ